jgi:hypothetical protein
MYERMQVATALRDNTTLPVGPSPPDLYSKQISLLPPVIEDSVPVTFPLTHFGDVKEQVLIISNRLWEKFYIWCFYNIRDIGSQQLRCR